MTSSQHVSCSRSCPPSRPSLRRCGGHLAGGAGWSARRPPNRQAPLSSGAATLGTAAEATRASLPRINTAAASAATAAKAVRRKQGVAEAIGQRDRRRQLRVGGEDCLAARKGDRRQNRDAERTADLLGGVDEAGGEAGIAFLDSLESRRSTSSRRPGRRRFPDTISAGSRSRT